MNLNWALRLFLMLICVNCYAQNWFNQLIEQKQQTNIVTNKREESFFKAHVLILFYSSQCPHCRRFAPVLKNWSKNQGAKVLPIAFDNQALKEFPHFIAASTEWVNAAYQERPIEYPALFIANSKSKTLYPAAFGFMTHDELTKRMQILIPKILSYERSKHYE